MVFYLTCGSICFLDGLLCVFLPLSRQWSPYFSGSKEGKEVASSAVKTKIYSRLPYIKRAPIYASPGFLPSPYFSARQERLPEMSSVESVSISMHTTCSTPHPHILYIIKVFRDDDTVHEVIKRYSEASSYLIYRIYALIFGSFSL